MLNIFGFVFSKTKARPARITALVLTVVLFSALLSGCGSSPEDTELMGSYSASDNVINYDVGAMQDATFAPMLSQWFICDITEDMMDRDYVFDEDNPKAERCAAFVINRDTNELLFGYNMLTPVYPASVTKLLTTLVVLQNCDLKDTVTIDSEVAAMKRGSVAELNEGDVITVYNLLVLVLTSSANNAAIGGALIPMLSLAIPGSPPSAVLLGALQLHGIRPGPMLTFDQPEFIPYMAALLLLASFMMRFSGWGICQIAPKILRIPFFILMPVVGVLSIIGAYALNVNMFDLTIMFIFGIIGYIFMKLKIPAAPIVLGLILGGMADSNFRRALQASQGSFRPFVTRPLSVIVLLLIFFTIFSQTPVYAKLKAAILRKKN